MEEGNAAFLFHFPTQKYVCLFSFHNKKAKPLKKRLEKQRISNPNDGHAASYTQIAENNTAIVKTPCRSAKALLCLPRRASNTC